MRSVVAKLIGVIEGILGLAFLGTAAATATQAVALGAVGFAQLAFEIAIGAWFVKLAVANFRAPKAPEPAPPP